MQVVKVQKGVANYLRNERYISKFHSSEDYDFLKTDKRVINGYCQFVVLDCNHKDFPRIEDTYFNMNFKDSDFCTEIQLVNSGAKINHIFTHDIMSTVPDENGICYVKEDDYAEIYY